MAQKIDQVYENAVASGLLPGVSVIAGDKDGESRKHKTWSITNTHRQNHLLQVTGQGQP